MWRMQWPARSCAPTTSGTWHLCWLHLCLRWPTQHVLDPRCTQRTCLGTAVGLRMMPSRQCRRITMSWLWHPNIWPCTCPSRSPSLYMPMPSCTCCSSSMTCWASTHTRDAGILYTWTLIATTWAWVGTVFMTVSDQRANTPSMSTFLSGSLARPVMHTGPSSWTSWYNWGPVPGTQHGNVAKLIGCMMKRHPTCSRWSGVVMSWWPFVARPSTARTLRAGTNCPARACRRMPMPMLWCMRPISMSWPRGARAAAWIRHKDWAHWLCVHLLAGVNCPVLCVP